MTEKQLARIFGWGTAAFVIVLAGMSVDTLGKVTRGRTPPLTDQVVAGKATWQRKNCNDCHTILGIGGYFAPDLTKVVQRIGPANWRRLHHAVYAIGTLGVLHYLWLVKADIRPPVIYGAILIVLLTLRLPSPPFLRLLRKPQPGDQSV